MSSSDALLALRQAIKSKTQVKYSNASGPTNSLTAATHLVLSPSVSLPKSTPTRIRKPNAKSTDPSANPQDFFTLDAIYIAWLLRDASGAEYMKQARENGLAVGFVSITERKSIVDWLEGRTNDLPSLVPVFCKLWTLSCLKARASCCHSRVYHAARFAAPWCNIRLAVNPPHLEVNRRDKFSRKEKIRCGPSRRGSGQKD